MFPQVIHAALSLFDQSPPHLENDLRWPDPQVTHTTCASSCHILLKGSIYIYIEV